MTPITCLDEYLAAERQADLLYDTPSRNDELLQVIEAMNNFEESHPEEMQRIYEDTSNLNEDPNYSFEDDWEHF